MPPSAKTSGRESHELPVCYVNYCMAFGMLVPFFSLARPLSGRSPVKQERSQAQPV